MIAINGNVANPFLTFFFRFLLLPTLATLLVAHLLLRVFYGKKLRGKSVAVPPGRVADPGLATLSKVSLMALVALTSAKIATALLGLRVDFRLTYIALLSAMPVIVLSPLRFKVIRNIDWHTLIFFASMFVLMESVWDSGFFQSPVDAVHLDLSSLGVIMMLSVLLSQLISNVPLVALYLPMLVRSGVSTKGMMALAAGSTVAGNLAVLGAASNVIIIQNGERRSDQTLTFAEFVKVGIPLTAANVLIYWAFLSL